MAHSRQTRWTILSGLDSAASSITQSSVVPGREISVGDACFLFQRIVAIPDLWPVQTFNGTATNCDRQAGTQG
jgi:hypothetical protein